MARENVGELWQVLIKPEFEEWKVTRQDGEVENFSSLRLLGSMLESEIDIESALILIDRVTSRIRTIVEHSDLTHARIARAVVDAINSDDSPEARYWRQNYLAVFGPEQNDTQLSELYINVRHKEQLKHHILNYFCELHGVDSEKKVKRLLGESEFSRLIDRFLRLIRYCGFFSVKRDFLNAFLEELAESSYKAIIPTATIGKDSAVNAVVEAERSILLALDEAGSNSALAKNAVHTAIENVGSVALRMYGLLPRRNSLGSFRRFVHMIDAVVNNSNGANGAFPDLREIRTQMLEDAHSQGLSVIDLDRNAKELLAALDDNHILRACRLARVTLPLIRLLISKDARLANIITCDFERGGTSRYAEFCLGYFQDKQLSAQKFGGDTVDLEIDFDYHELLDLGRVLRIRFVHDEEEWSTNAPWIEAVINDCDESNEILPVIVTDVGVTAAAIDSLRSSLRSQKRCAAIVDRPVFEAALHRLPTLRDVVQTALIPKELPWRKHVFKGNQVSVVPPRIIGGERWALEKTFAQIDQDHGAVAWQGGRRVARELLSGSICFFSIPVESTQRGMQEYLKDCR